MSYDSGDTFDKRLAELLIPADVVAASEQLFTGAYGKVLTFTLSPTTP